VLLRGKSLFMEAKGKEKLLLSNNRKPIYTSSDCLILEFAARLSI
jgi:hypothetical protein